MVKMKLTVLVMMMSICPVFPNFRSNFPGSCCPQKKVGGIQYELKEVSDTSQYGCNDPCVYTKVGDTSSEPFCFGSGTLESKCIEVPVVMRGNIRHYCQPTNTSCWPTQDEITDMKDYFKGDSCMGLPKFVDVQDQKAHEIMCKDYQGLQYKENVKSMYGNNFQVFPPEKCETSITSPPDMYCDPNPFITRTYYKDGPSASTTTVSGVTTSTASPATTTGPQPPSPIPKHACMTPYQFLTNRNFYSEFKPAFIITAKTNEEVQMALRFAKNHDLGVTVMGTGHELLDRNAGPGPNSLLIRTTCFRNFTFKAENITDYKGTWTDGYAIVGAGTTFGQNFWWSLDNSEGLYKLAQQYNKEAVGGTCHSVGVVGWTMGGGRGWTAPQYGLGVDQLLAATVVTAKGDEEIIEVGYDNEENSDLFRALRGGGPGWGIITELKFKLHTPRCGNYQGCYHQYLYVWDGIYNQDTVPFLKELFSLYITFSLATRDKYWNSAFNIGSSPVPQKDTTWEVSIDYRYFGHKNDEDWKLLETLFLNKLPLTSGSYKEYKYENTNEYWCDIVPKTGYRECAHTENHRFSRLGFYTPYLMFQIDEEAANNPDFRDDFFSLWTPFCQANGKYTGCVNGYHLRGDYPKVVNGEFMHATDSVLGSKNKKTAFCVYLTNFGIEDPEKGGPFSLQEKMNEAHYEIQPIMYKYSQTSYFNEAEYSLKPGQWIKRFWDVSVYEQELVETKKKYDPETRFSCRLCVGDLYGDNLGN